MKISLIDADSLIYIIAWNHRESYSNLEVLDSCEFALKEILLYNQATHYIGAFSGKKCFRKEVYRYAPYKGNRGEKQEHVVRWEPVITDYFMNKHGFVREDRVEADDIIAAASHLLRDGFCGQECETVICSPDKDLRQIPGYHYDYRSQKSPEGEMVYMPAFHIDELEANRRFCMQMLCGDSGDNIAGVPGIGEVKAKKILEEAIDPVAWLSTVKNCYCKYFGSHYGPIIFEETLHTVQLLTPAHPLWTPKTWNDWDPSLELPLLISTSIKELNTAKGIFDIA